MKIYLISAFLCLAGLAHGASIQRIARNSETIIPTIVEEILKVELQSDLKKNSAVEAAEAEPLIKKVEPTLNVEPIASRTVEDAALPATEEKKPEILEILAVKEIIPEPLPAVIKAEPLPEVVEKIETVAIKDNAEKPLDNFRTESVPSVEQPIAEIVKETVVIEPVLELRQEPAAAVVIKEEEIIKPMSRNVIKEEIPQVEELRNILPEETIAVKETVPEPVASSNIVEPVVEIQQEVKSIETAPISKADTPALLAVVSEPEAPLKTPEAPIEESKADLTKPEAPLKAETPLLMTEAILLQAEIIPEKKAEEPSAKLETIIPEIKVEKIEAPAPAPIVQEIKAIPEIKPVPETVAPGEEKPLLVAAAPSVEESGPEIRQDGRQTIAQQITTALSNVPVVGPLISNLNPSSAVAADESSAVTDEAATPERPNLLQQVLQNTQNALNNAVQAFNPPSTNVAADGEATTRAPGPFQNAITFAQGALQNVANGVQNIINPTPAPAKEEEKPLKEEEKPLKDEEKPLQTEDKIKTVVSEPQVAEVAPVVAVKPEETQKVVEEKENLVKN